ncbi:MAG: excinuclease ABC subunit UvrC [Campylobacterales bacterium]|nr:excinuclease ABC subunit UvrC [Campylobacterales bacterium]
MNKLNPILLKQIQHLPKSAGVYHYFDENGKLLYIGKAKNLFARVKSYFRFSPLFTPNPAVSSRILKMLHEVHTMHYILVENEHDALILENSLIKQLRPKYNILLRDDKTYPYIYFDKSEEFPRFEITRTILSDKQIEYYGPFSTAARDILNALYELLPLIQTKSCLKSGKACLYYQIKKCFAPCEKKISGKEYARYIDKGVAYIHDKKRLCKDLEIRMVELSEEMRFEEAALLRDSIEKISKSSTISQIDLASSEDIDLFSVDADEKRAVVLRLFMRQGKIISSSHNFVHLNHGFDRDELYKRAIVEFYQFSPLTSKQIIVPHAFEEMEDVQAYLKETFSKAVDLYVPKRGPKANLCALALKNTRELLNNYAHEADSSYEDLEEKLQELCTLQNLPKRIEIFDNSHLQGSAPVGAMVCFEEGKFNKSGYRQYHLESLDEYAQMRETLTRRIGRFETNPPPDLWILDGGATLLSLARDLLESSGVNLDVLAISKEKLDAKAHRAKGKAKDILHSKDQSFALSTSDKRLQWVQRMRDEAHRYAITFHKKTKLKQDQASTLLQTRGIGPAKLKKLLNHFGSFEALKEAKEEDIADVVGKNDATSIKRLYK